MKKILSLCLFLLTASRLYAQESSVVLFPVIDDKVMCEKVVDVPGASAGTIHVRAFKWLIDAFEERESIVDDMDANQLIDKVETIVDIYTVSFKVQIDSKDNKFRYRIFDIKRTVTGKDESSLFSKYLVNVPAEKINNIVLGLEKGFSKGQRKDAQESIILIQSKINQIISSLQKAVVIKKEEF